VVVDVTYKKGKFINAMSHAKASEDNESNTVVLREPSGAHRPVAVVKQIVGLIARRIICTVKPNDGVTRGQRIGMIKFGSRTELTIPMWLKPTIKVKVGDTVRGAADVIATLGEPIHTIARQEVAEEFEPIVGRETPA
jgi:phosphatidylserine decarboxylase